MKQHVRLLASTNQVKFVMYIYGGGFGLTQLTSFAQCFSSVSTEKNTDSLTVSAYTFANLR